jgi:alkyl hydroperoxide reductase subunit F
MDNEKIYQVIIIGGGPAAFTAALYTLRKKNELIILTGEVGGQAAKTNDIQNWPGLASVSGPKLMQDMRTQAEAAGAIIKEGKKIASVKKSADKPAVFEVISEDGEKYFSKTVIIATGKSPRKLGVKGDKEFENKGLTYCPICDAPLFAGKNVAVVGGGNSGLYAAEDLLKYANKIYVLEYEKTMRGDKQAQEKLKRSGKVEFLTYAKVEEVMGDNFVKGLKYTNREDNLEYTLDVEGVFVEIGSVTNTGPVKDLVKLAPWGEIEVNSKCETSVPGIYAAGDVATTPYKQIIIAAGEGAKAALAADEYLNKMEVEEISAKK